MPIARIQVLEGVFSDDQLDSMMKKVTEAMISVEGEAMRDKTWVLVEEVRGGLWAIGGTGPQLKATGS